jgi:hypothetical protein
VTNAHADEITLREIAELPEGRSTIFWATENKRRACSLNRLEKAGRISSDNSVGYPRLIFKELK